MGSTMLLRRACVLAAVCVGAVLWTGTASASLQPLVTYNFETGTPTCGLSIGSSPASSAAPGIVGGPFSQTWGYGCVGWVAPGTYDTNALNPTNVFPYFSFTVQHQATLTALYLRGWTDAFWWTGSYGWSVEISAANQPLPSYYNPQPSWTSLGILGAQYYGFNIGQGLYPITLGPGTYTIRLRALSDQYDWSRQLDFNSVTLYGDVVNDTTPPVVTPTVHGTLGTNGWYTSDVSVSWSVSDPESAISSESGCGDQTVTADTAGVTFTCTATSSGGTTKRDVTIKRDATPPTVEYSGNAGSYTVDQQVTITCAAGDNLSGVASTDCADVTGPAYSFGLGSHDYSASATDAAGNTAGATTSFTVAVTYDSLCGLVQQFSTSTDVASGLCDKLASAQAADQRGQTKTRNNILAAFSHQVSAQTGKALTAAQASILASLVDGLEA